MSKKLISVPPCNWDVTNNYLNKKETYIFGSPISSPAKMKFLLKLETVGKMERRHLTVEINGESKVYTLKRLLGKKSNDYWIGDKSLTSVLESYATLKGNKIKIY